MQERCDGYGRSGLGVRLEGVSLADLHPPQEVVEAYHQVTMAMEKSDERVNQATADALGRERDGGGEKDGDDPQGGGGGPGQGAAGGGDARRRDGAGPRPQGVGVGPGRALLRDAVLEAWNDPLPDEDERARRAARITRNGGRRPWRGRRC